ncbi:MAG TPA: tetratricopeptide repeat protein, partial [Nitrospinaceae bacterium]|nr:tetratricopeptide repeat protein [Nitrospinaceae bacterium]
FLFFSLTLLIYFPAITGEFIWDDDLHLTDNKQLESVEGLKNIWLKPGATFQYFPLTFTSFWIEKRLWGDNPIGYHVINLLLHTSSALLLWRILVLLSIPGATLAALIFLMHPVNVESVAWITERKNTLSGLFYFVSLTFYLKFLQIDNLSSPPKKKKPKNNSGLFYALSIISFLLAISSKAATCTLPAVFLLIIWWKKNTIKLKDVLRVTPFLLLTLIIARITIFTEKNSAGAQGADWDFSFWERFIIAGKSLWLYLYILINPLNISFTYPKWSVVSSIASHYLPSFSFLFLIVGLVFFREKIGKSPLVAILFFSGTLFPALGFFNIYYMRYSFATDHFQYLACIGPIALFSGSMTVFAKSASRSSGPIKVLSYFLPVFSAAILLVLGLLTWKHTHIFKNQEMLWRDTLLNNPRSALAHHNLGRVLEKRGNLIEGVEHYQKALALNPTIPVEALGGVLEKLGKTKQAETVYKQALERGLNSSVNHLDLADFLYRVGSFTEAVTYYKKAIALNPDYATAHYNLGNALGQLGQLGEAQKSFEQALSLNAKHPLAHYGLGVIHQRSKQYPKAIQAFEQALSINPKLERTHFYLGEVYDELGQGEKAILHLRLAENLSRQNQNQALQDKARIKLEALHEKYATASTKEDG